MVFYGQHLAIYLSAIPWTQKYNGSKFKIISIAAVGVETDKPMFVCHLAFYIPYCRYLLCITNVYLELRSQISFTQPLVSTSAGQWWACWLIFGYVGSIKSLDEAYPEIFHHFDIWNPPSTSGCNGPCSTFFYLKSNNLCFLSIDWFSLLFTLIVNTNFWKPLFNEFYRVDKRCTFLYQF